MGTQGAGGADSAFDFARLADISGGDPEFEREILADYLLQGTGLIEALEGAVAAGDAATLRQAAHTLKGTSHTVGAEAVGLGSAEMEHIGAGGDIALAATALARTRAAFEQTRVLIARYLDGGLRRTA